jgi:hypothetical protein
MKTVTESKSGAESYRIVMDKSGTPISSSLKREVEEGMTTIKVSGEMRTCISPSDKKFL